MRKIAAPLLILVLLSFLSSAICAEADTGSVSLWSLKNLSTGKVTTPKNLATQNEKPLVLYVCTPEVQKTAQDFALMKQLDAIYDFAVAIPSSATSAAEAKK